MSNTTQMTGMTQQSSDIAGKSVWAMLCSANLWLPDQWIKGYDVVYDTIQDLPTNITKAMTMPPSGGFPYLESLMMHDDHEHELSFRCTP